MQSNRPSLHVFSLVLALWCVGCPEKDATENPKPSKAQPRAEGASLPPVPKGKSQTPKVTPDREEDTDASSIPALPPLTPAGGLTFDVRNESLWVHSPLLGTSLSERAHAMTKTSVEGDTITIFYEDQLSCTPQEKLRHDVRYFQARLENTRAFRVYKEGRFAEAARGFRRAMELDDHYGKARTNYIAALCRAGDLNTAKNAYSRAYSKDPISTYVKLLEDDDFKPLRSELRTSNTVQPALRLVHDDLLDYAGFSKERGLLAVVRKEISWGAQNWTAELHVLDVRSRQLVSKHTLVRWHDITEDGRVKAAVKKELSSRLERFNEALTALQFRAAPAGTRGEFRQPAPVGGAVKAPLSGLGLSVVAQTETLRLMRGKQVLDTFHSTLKGSRPSVVYGVPEMNSLIYFGAYEVAEGCDSGPGTLLEVFPTDQLAPAQK